MTYEALYDLGPASAGLTGASFSITALQPSGLFTQSFDLTMLSFLLMAFLWSHCVLSSSSLSLLVNPYLHLQCNLKYDFPKEALLDSIQS